MIGHIFKSQIMAERFESSVSSDVKVQIEAHEICSSKIQPAHVEEFNGYTNSLVDVFLLMLKKVKIQNSEILIKLLPPAFYFLSGEKFNKELKSFWVEEFEEIIQISCKKCVSGFKCEFSKYPDGSFMLSEIHSTVHDILEHPHSTEINSSLQVTNEISETSEEIESYLRRVLGQDKNLVESLNQMMVEGDDQSQELIDNEVSSDSRVSEKYEEEEKKQSYDTRQDSNTQLFENTE